MEELPVIVQSLWKLFERKKIRAIVPRNFEDLPYNLKGDLDIFIHPDDLIDARTIVIEVLTAVRFRPLFEQIIWNHHHLAFWHPRKSIAKEPEIFRVDLQTQLGWKGFRYAPVEQFLEETERHNGVRIPTAAARAVALALHCILDKGCVREKNRKAMQRDNVEGLQTFASAVLPVAAASSLVRWIKLGAPDEYVKDLSKTLRGALLRAYPLNGIRPLVVRMKRWLRYFVRRRGILVAFIGPDGSGKSTVIERIQEILRTAPFPVRLAYMGKRDPFLPTSRIIRAFYQRREGLQNEAVASENSPRLLTRIGRAMKDIGGLINWVIEQWARYLVLIRPYLQQDGVVLVDRYSFDFAYREPWSISHRPFFIKMLCRFFPVPDLTFLLWENPQVLFDRKGERSVEELGQLIERFRLILQFVPSSREIRTNKSVTITAAKIATKIAEQIESKCHF
jgi:thymidylate kinase